MKYAKLTDDEKLEHCKRVITDVVEIINDSCHINNRSYRSVSISLQFRDLITSLRGPDVKNTHLLKGVTTARIRHKIGIKISSGLDCNPDSSPIELIAVEHMGANYHFLHHFNHAVKALKTFHYIPSGKKKRE